MLQTILWWGKIRISAPCNSDTSPFRVHFDDVPAQSYRLRLFVYIADSSLRVLLGSVNISHSGMSEATYCIETLASSFTKLSTTEESEKKSLQLLDHASRLLSELEEFRQYISSGKQTKPVEFRHFRSAVQSEFKSLEKVGLDSSHIHCSLT